MIDGSLPLQSAKRAIGSGAAGCADTGGADDSACLVGVTLPLAGGLVGAGTVVAELPV